MAEAGVRRIVVGISGASGIALGVEALVQLRALPGVESHLIITEAARGSIAQEMSMTVKEISDLADETHRNNDLGDALSSGSFPVESMIIAPCSIKTLSAIANSYDSTLIVRAADVCLKERRRLVLMVRETPLHAGHLRLMSLATESGAIVMPPVPAFYARPQTIEQMVSDTISRALSVLGVHTAGQHWTGRGSYAERGED